jgi:hypothetical protein
MVFLYQLYSFWFDLTGAWTNDLLYTWCVSTRTDRSYVCLCGDSTKLWHISHCGYRGVRFHILSSRVMCCPLTFICICAWKYTRRPCCQSIFLYYFCLIDDSQFSFFCLGRFCSWHTRYTVDRWFKLRSSQTKNYIIGICYFSAWQRLVGSESWLCVWVMLHIYPRTVVSVSFSIEVSQWLLFKTNVY